MRLTHSILFAAAAALGLAGGALAQNAISAKAGMVNVADGDVFLIDAKGGEPKKVEPKITEVFNVQEGQTLKTTEGRAEVLLVPGSFLRMADDSSFRLTSNKLTDARLEILSGSALIEVSESLADDKITVALKDATVTFAKAGLYRFDADPARVRVYLGEATMSYGNGQSAILKGGKGLVAGASGWSADRFDSKETDALYRWAKRRSGYIAMANLSAARQATPNTSGLRSGSWYWNPYFGFATFVPWGNTLRNPFGYYYYTPQTVMDVYYPPAWAYGGSGGGHAASSQPGWSAGMASRSAGVSTYSPSAAITSSNSVSSSAGSSSSVGAGSAGSRGGGGSTGGSTGGGSAVGGGGGRGGRN